MAAQAFRFLMQHPSDMPEWVRDLKPTVFLSETHMMVKEHPTSLLHQRVEYGDWLIRTSDVMIERVSNDAFNAVRAVMIAAVEEESAAWHGDKPNRMGDAATRSAIRAMQGVGGNQ